MPTRKEVLMRSANLLNDFAFKYVFGEDCKEANDALKSLLTVFLERKVNHVVVKNSEMVKDYTKMKSPRLDLLVEFDDKTTVDLEMQLRQTKDNLLNRFNYYLARLHGSQDMEGKSYSQLKETIVMVFFNLIIADDDDICSLYTMRKYSGIPLVKDENEERIELQLELEEAQRQMKEARKEKEEARKEKEEAHKEKEEARKAILEADKKVEQMVRKMHESGMSLEQISAYCSLNVNEIELLIKS